MSISIILLLFIFGTIIGSFLNVAILRYNTGKPILAIEERSECFSCGKQLKWWELLPVVSFVFLRAKCSACKSKISWQYPIVELLTGLILVSIFLKFQGNLSETIFHFIVWSILIVITFYDLKHKIIPDLLVFGFIFLSFAFNLFLTGYWSNFFLDSFSSLDFWAGPIFALFFASLWFFSGGRWLGFGDAKLVLGIGFLLGWSRGVSALMLAFWIGAIVGLFIIGWSALVRRNVIPTFALPSSLTKLTMKSEIPFAPFLILGLAIVFFGNVAIIAF